MSTVAGRRCLELALAITLALQSTTGWTVLLAVVVYWVVVVVVAGLIDERAEARATSLVNRRVQLRCPIPR
ncbi:hypothetical protein [Xanthomonas campestris]|uniref:hypothetical protein n=1 Tax=Xanthomonas campestris TaxID=339 RepID=UPI001CBC2DD7|nr:hypothetical protein [Xanthomonas campestris]MEA9490522.1 hypothetical protein [Xanthomonas campestris]MEA9509274.1 hypothetical protein [Xanthomonas campestris]MEA9577038.1 hypothetical protein [Xanthomonas campestris]MEA9731591.1 hypothetical protein [Xanthomonas campestris]MEB2112314.1 hypothetical protein [Xanthomonas campestris pv. campestris]